MKVWVVKGGYDYEGSGIEGIYDSPEKGQAALDSLKIEMAKHKRYHELYWLLNNWGRKKLGDKRRFHVFDIMDRIPQGTCSYDSAWMHEYEVL